MKVHDADALPYLQSLARAIIHAPQSFAAWSCVLLKANEDTPFSTTRLASRRLGKLDGDAAIVILPNRDLLLFSREHDLNIFRSMSQQLGGTTEQMLAVHNLYADKAIVLAMLEAITAGAPHDCRNIAHQAKFSAASVESHVFDEVKRQRRTRSPQHILVVDDDALTRRVMTGLFKNDFAMITAQTAQEAVAEYLLHAPDIVFLDIGLPDRSGIDALHDIIGCDPDAYVIMVSGNSHIDTMTATLTNGASGFIAKPFQRDRMRSYIAESITHHHKNYA